MFIALYLSIFEYRVCLRFCRVHQVQLWGVMLSTSSWMMPEFLWTALMIWNGC